MRKLSKIIDKKTDKEPQPDLEQRWRMLQARAILANRHPERVPELRAYLAENPEQRAYIRSLAGAAKEGLLEKIVTGEGSRVLIETHLQDVQQKLCGPNPSPAETLLVEAVLMCWLRVQYAELYRTATMNEGTGFRAVEHAEKVLTQSYNRYTRALSHLAKVQRLSPQKAENAEDKESKPIRLLKTNIGK